MKDVKLTNDDLDKYVDEAFRYIFDGLVGEKFAIKTHTLFTK